MSGAMRWHTQWLLLCLLCLFHVLCNTVAVSQATAQPVCASSLEELNKETFLASPQHKLLYTSSTTTSSNESRVDRAENVLFGVHEANGPSACAGPMGCPRAAMVWASGTLTFPGLLTPGSFTPEANLTLRLSLCCDYLFRGDLLHNATLYDEILRVLLQASPLQVLTREERRAAFPRLRARLLKRHTEGKESSVHVATNGNVQANTRQKTQSEAQAKLEQWMAAAAKREAQVSNNTDNNISDNTDDGDVLVLYTGELPIETVARLHEVLTPTSTSRPDLLNDSGAGHERVWLDRHMADVQLKITNAVLKCKCPHTLLVMPLLRLQPDELPLVQIRGIGTHCAPQALLTAAAATTYSNNEDVHGPQLHCIRTPSTSGTSDEAGMQYAMRFSLTPPHIIPGTRVTWHVTRRQNIKVGAHNKEEDEEEGNVVLHDSRVVQASIDSRRHGGGGGLVLSDAASLYFIVTPNTHYEVEVRVSRGPFLTQVQRGEFLLREPFPSAHIRHTPHVVVPHFGFRRYVQLNEETIAQARSHITHMNTYNGGDNTDELYRGYWESVPVTRTAISAQQYLRLRDDAWLHNSSNSNSGVYFTLQPGRNVLQYTVHDKDDVCPATVLETHVVWAVQSVMTHEPIRTACEETLDVGAVSVHGLVHTMRNNLHMPLSFSSEAHESVLREGYFHCKRHTPHNWKRNNNTVKEEKGVVLRLGKQATEAECVIRGQTIQGDNHEVRAVVQLTKRGVYGLRWVIELYVHNASLVAPANIDPAYAIVTKLHENETQQNNNSNTSEKSVWRVLVYSHEQILVRRALRRPSGAVHVVLPMHLRRWRIEPPRPSSPHADNMNSVEEEDNMRVVRGRWEVQWPLQVYSVDEWASAELNTAAVPNIIQVLPANTLRFVLYDPGQDLSVLYGISYRARCPDQIIPYTIQVIAQPAPQVYPDTEVVYTERNCIALRAPRPARKDEHIEWHVLPCSEGRVTRMRLLGVNEYALRRHEQTTKALAEAAGRDIHRVNTLEEERESGVGGYDAEDIPTAQRNTNYEDNSGDDMQEGSVMYVCDIAPFEHCAVRWTARNAAGVVTKTFALRRCMQPPRLIYHGSDEHIIKDERVRVGAFSHVVPHISILETTTATTTTTSSEIVTAGNGEGVVRGRMWHVLPLVGREVTWGYSFDYREGPQTHFEAAFALMPHGAAHQLPVTSLLYEAKDKVGEEENMSTYEGRTTEEDKLSAQNASQVQTRLLAWRQAALERHLVPLTHTPQNRESADETIVAEYDDYDLMLHRLHLWQPAHVTHSDTTLDRTLDAAANAAVRLTHNAVTRRVTMYGLTDSALYPINYTICTATTTQSNATSPEALDAAEFARRGLCRRRTGRLVVLAFTPRGVIEPQALRIRNHTQSTTSDSNSSSSTSFEAYAPPVLAFCASSYRFSRHPDLYSVYGYDFNWRCDGRGLIRVERHGPTHSTLYHTSESSNNTHEKDTSSMHATSEEDTLCELTVSNRLTQTTQTEMFALRRVFPTPSESLRFVILSPNTLEATREGLNIVPTPNNDSTTEEIRKATRPARLRRIIGTSVVLHIDHAKADHMKYESEQHGKLDGWAVVYVVPATQLASGTQVMSQSVEFTPLPRHPAALARHTISNNSDEEGVTVLVSGMNIAGLYALQYHLPDPTEPELCPGHRIHETFEVIRARIVTMKELYLCGDETTLQAVPLPRDLQTDFYTRWELYSVQVSPNITHYYYDSETSAFEGVRFSQFTSPQTRLSGLGFGIYTVRWAIYKRSANASEAMTLVDHDTIRVFVLTDNLRSERLVTLGSDMTLQTTSSMSNFTLVKTTSTSSSSLMHGHWKGTTRPVELSLQHCTGTCVGSGNNVTTICDANTAADAIFPLLTLRHLPLGITQVRYTLRPSARVFGAMRGHTCAVSRLIQVKRLGAFVHAETTLDHECDAYRGSARITLWLHTGTTNNTSNTSNSTSQVHFIGLDRFEAIAKRDALALVNTLHSEEQQQQRDEGNEECVLPWWLQSDATWHDLHYVNSTSHGARRCVDFAVRAGHYLSPHTLQQPLFTLQGKAHRSDSKTEELRCTRIAGLLSSRLIEGDGLFVPTHHSNAHSTTSDVVGPVTYLPLLDSHTLTPLPHRMRALLGVTTTQTVLSELDLAQGNATSVLLRLKLKAENDDTKYAGFIAHEDNNTSDSIEGKEKLERASISSPSLLMKCVEGSVRGRDVLQYWHSTNNKGDEKSTRSHEATGDAMGEWVRYVEAMRGVPVRCEVLFHSLDKLLHHVEDNEESSEAARAHATLQAALSSHTTDDHTPRSTNMNERKKYYTGTYRVSSEKDEAGLVTLEVLERQLHSLQEDMQWTRDHIDVTGLSPELQQALSRRRITRRQLEVLQATRQRRRGSDNDGIDTHIIKEEQSGQQHHTDILPITSSTSLSVTTNEASQAARVRHILQMYHSLTGEESVAVRLTLPSNAAFAIDHNVSVRTALHKDIICGTSPIDSVHPERREEKEDNNELVEFGFVSITDSTPSVQLSPWQVKQCELEAGLPLLRLHMSGSRFALIHNIHYNKQEEKENEEEVMWHRVDARDVELEEVIPVHSNTTTSLSSTYVVRGEGESESEIGLRPCFAAMRAGMQVALSGRTHKELYLRLGACPHFAMLASAEYNENQNSTLLLQRLHTPRYLRVTIHRALATQPTHSDSHTEDGMAELRANGDVRVVVQVRPTLARLHMRTAQPTSAEQHTLPLSSHTTITSDVFQATRQRRPLLLCERDMRRTGLQLGIELVGDRWTDPVGQSGAVRATTSNKNDTTGEATRKSVRSPQDVALLNSFSVVEHHSLESMPQLYLRGGGVYRSHFVNYLFTVLLAEPTVNSGHTFVRRYNDSFIALVLPPDPQGVPHDSLSFTQRGTSDSDSVDVRDMLRAWLDDGDAQRSPLSHTSRTQALPYTTTTTDKGSGYEVYQYSESDASEVPALPAVRRFSKVEEILFAVPGFATECRGCLLADTTFFVAGDFTGVWRIITTSNSILSAYPTRQELLGPLTLPWYTLQVIPRVWHYVWTCPRAAEYALWDLINSDWFRLAASSVRVPYVELRVMLYTEHTESGQIRYGDARLQTLLTSEPVPITELVRNVARTHAYTSLNSNDSDSDDDIKQQWPVVFTVSEAAAARAHATLSSDLQRYKHGQRSSAMFRYHDYHFTSEDEHAKRGAGILHAVGAGRRHNGLVVNASVYLRLCVPLAANDEVGATTEEYIDDVDDKRKVRPVVHAMCSTVSITDALLAVEAPRHKRQQQQTSSLSQQSQAKVHLWQRMWRRMRGKDTEQKRNTSELHSALRWPIYAVHHAFLASLLFSVLPETGLLCRGSLRAATSEERHLARYIVSAVTFVALGLLALCLPPLWSLAWLLLWCVFMYFSTRPGAGLLFLASTVIWRCVA